MKLIFLFFSSLVILSSCKGQSSNTSASDRDAQIVAAITEKMRIAAEKTQQPAVKDLTIVHVDSLTATEYFSYANKNRKKLLEFQKDHVLGCERNVRLDSLLMLTYKDQRKEYAASVNDYNESVEKLRQAIADLNQMQKALDSCDMIVSSTPNAFFGFYVQSSFRYPKDGTYEKSLAPFLVSKEFVVSIP